MGSCLDFDTSGCTGLGPECGDKNATGFEVCDGSDLRGQDCTDHGFVAGALSCAPDCKAYDTTHCREYECNNGTLEPPEVCDGFELGGRTCEQLGFASGSLVCGADCLSIDTTGCVPSQCGNDAIDPGEKCDGSDLGGQTCEGLGYVSGTLACDQECQYDESGCVVVESCGNNQLDPQELCEGYELRGATCENSGYGDSGQLACTDQCTHDISDCHTCGNDLQEGPEACDDGNQLSEEKCPYGSPTCVVCNADCSASLQLTGPYCGDHSQNGDEACDGSVPPAATCGSEAGHQQGELSCKSDCTFDTSHCATCGNGIPEYGELCDGSCPTNCDDYDPCTSNDLVNPGTCQAYCEYPALTSCQSGDDCCVPGCTSDADAECLTSCGGTEGIDCTTLPIPQFAVPICAGSDCDWVCPAGRQIDDPDNPTICLLENGQDCLTNSDCFNTCISLVCADPVVHDEPCDTGDHDDCILGFICREGFCFEEFQGCGILAKDSNWHGTGLVVTCNILVPAGITLFPRKRESSRLPLIAKFGFACRNPADINASRRGRIVLRAVLEAMTTIATEEQEVEAYTTQIKGKVLIVTLPRRLSADLVEPIFQEVVAIVEEKQLNAVIYETRQVQSFDKKVVLSATNYTRSLTKQGIRFGVVATSGAVRLAASTVQLVIQGRLIVGATLNEVLAELR